MANNGKGSMKINNNGGMMAPTLRNSMASSYIVGDPGIFGKGAPYCKISSAAPLRPKVLH